MITSRKTKKGDEERTKGNVWEDDERREQIMRRKDEEKT